MKNVNTKDNKKNKKQNPAIRIIKDYIDEHQALSIVWAVLYIYLNGLISLAGYTIYKAPDWVNNKANKPFTLNPLIVFQEYLHLRGWIFLIITACALVAVYRLVLFPRIKQERGKLDERGFRVLTEDGKYGTAELVTDPEELGDVIDLKPVKDTTGIILGKPLSADTSQIKIDSDEKIKNAVDVISVPSDSEYVEKSKKLDWNIDDFVNNKLNNHIAIFGASGTMKSRAMARNLIMQDAKRGESIIITDPKSELYEDCAPFLEEMGYDVKMFNLVNQKHSDSWNCLLELLDENGEVDDTNAKIFADTIVMNATGEQDYWSDNARNILKAVCLYVMEVYPREEQSMATVYDIVSSKTTQEIDIMFRSLPEDSVARRSYNIFGVCTEQVKGQILNGLGIMLDIFQDNAIRNITSSDEINLSKPATEKCAYFCITSDQHSVFDFLIVLFYAMLFVKLVNKVDSLRHDPNIKTIPINLVMDEFPNIGQVPAFCKKISTVRSRKINISIIFQNIVQLQNRYPMGQWEEILGNCDTTIFLGCTDETTAKYISDKTGIATIEVETQNTKYERDVMIFNQNTSYNEVRSAGQRKVLNPDEILRIKNTEELIFLRGRKPLKAKKYDYSLHPWAQKLVPGPISDHKPLWKQKQEAEEFEKEMLKQKREREAQLRQEEELRKIKEESKRKEKEDKENAENALFGMFNAVNKAAENKTKQTQKKQTSKSNTSDNKETKQSNNKQENNFSSVEGLGNLFAPPITNANDT